MNDNPELGSAWKGRILMHIESEEVKHPERKSQALDETIKQTAISLGLYEEKDYEIIAEVGCGIALPSNNTYYKVMIKIGDHEMTTGWPKEYKQGYNRFSERFQQAVFKSTFPSVEEMDTVFVYLMDGSYPICYWKGKVADFMDPNPQFQWLRLKNDKAVGKVDEDHEAGMLQFKLSINDVASNGQVDFKNFDAWRKPPPRRLGSKKIRCFIFQCRDIPAADEDGASDAYISVWNPNNEDLRTRMIEDSVNPIYYETVEMFYDFADIESAPPIILNVWDHDSALFDSTDDFLGRAVIYLQDASTNLEFGDDESRYNEVPKPIWHDIRFGFDASMPACGQILCSFVVARDDFAF